MRQTEYCTLVVSYDCYRKFVILQQHECVAGRGHKLYRIIEQKELEECAQNTFLLKRLNMTEKIILLCSF